MAYYNNRPLNPTPRPTAANRYFQWRDFPEDSGEIVSKIQSDFDHVKSETRSEKYFIVPGRDQVIPRIVNDNRFELRTLVDASQSVEEWERTIQTEFPMRRTQSAMIGSFVPRFRGALCSVATPESLTDALSRKSRYFDTTKTCEVYSRDGVEVRIEQVKVEERLKTSVSIRANSREEVESAVKSLGAKIDSNCNFADFLRAA